MAKISPVSAKYIVQGLIEIDGAVDKPDVIGAIFGQTEGLLGADLELRELQRSGRIGRIEVDTETKAGKTKGKIIIPSSLDKVETCIIGASLETIQRIGPCNAKIQVQKIEDVRVSKRNFVTTEQSHSLRNLMEGVMPDSQELADEVADAVRVMELQSYGADKLPAGPAIDDSEEIIIVEGRADVLTLLKHGFKNVIGLQGTSVPKTINELSKKKECTVFVDGDRGGDLIIKELLQVAEIDHITKAPEGKEVEELTKKEIHKAIRARVNPEQFSPQTKAIHIRPSRPAPVRRPVRNDSPPPRARRVTVNADLKNKFSKMLDELVGTKGAFILDDKLNTLGRVPTTELTATLRNLRGGVHAVILDGTVGNDIVFGAEKLGVKYLVGKDSSQKSHRLTILTTNELK